MLLKKTTFRSRMIHAFAAVCPLLVGCGDSASSPVDGGSQVASDSRPSGAGGGTGGTTGAGGSSSTVMDSGAGACDPSYKCMQALVPPGNDPTKLCAGSVAATKFAAVGPCLCGGPCTQKCSDSVCAQQAPSADCLACIMDVVAGCGVLVNECLAN